MPADGIKKLLADDNYARYRAYMLNAEPELRLPSISNAPGIAVSRRMDIYKKTVEKNQEAEQCSVKFITKNNEPYAFVWETTAKKLKEATCWGIIKPESMTGKVIYHLGKYRVIAYDRVSKGMMSNSHVVKLKLVDLYQARFKALEALESLVNKENGLDDFNQTFAAYIAELESIKAQLDQDFRALPRTGFDTDTILQIKNDIDADIQRTRVYQAGLAKATSLSAYCSARGPRSIMVFVKEQMLHGLYELQGINEDMTYSRKRYFALTRGELNDLIEDARKDIDQHQVDIHNSVTEKHHGIYGLDDEPRYYEFPVAQLSRVQERETLLAISFIEGWDKLAVNTVSNTGTVQNRHGEERLDTIAATKWKTHRHGIAFFKSMGFYLLNMIAGIFVSTKPWEEHTWIGSSFNLVAAQLWRHIAPKGPLWKKPYEFFKKAAYILVDLCIGVKDTGQSLGIHLFEDVVNDWRSTQDLEDLAQTLQGIGLAIQNISAVEQSRLETIFTTLQLQPTPLENLSYDQFATVDYLLTGGDHSDILTVVAKGLDNFGSVFYHNFAKNPVQGVLFTAGYAIGAGAIFLPTMTASAFGPNYVKWFTDFAYSMASAPMSAMIAGASIQGHFVASSWELLTQGPNGRVMKTVYNIGEDPISSAAYVVAAYGLGHVLLNVVAPYKIPVISQYLEAELGTNRRLCKLVAGGKYGAFVGDALNPKQLPDGSRIDNTAVQVQQNNDQIKLLSFLLTNASMLTKLEAKQRFMLSRQIDNLFRDTKDRESLKKLIYPEIQYSVAYNLLRLPLYYPVAALRIVVSVLFSFLALVKCSKHPLEPVHRAITAMQEQMKKNFSHLMVAAAHFTYFGYVVPATVVKMAMSLATMAITRVVGLFNGKPAHALHRLMAASHVFFRSLGEYLYPSSLVKDIGSAHPIHTARKIETSYGLMVKRGLDAANASAGAGSGILCSAEADGLRSVSSQPTIDTNAHERPPAAPPLQDNDAESRPPHI